MRSITKLSQPDDLCTPLHYRRRPHPVIAGNYQFPVSQHLVYSGEVNAVLAELNQKYIRCILSDSPKGVK